MHMPFFFGPLVNYQNEIIENSNRSEDTKLFSTSYNISYKQDSKSLFLFDSVYFSLIFDIIPKHFTIITNNNIPHKFNVELLKDTSTVIYDLLKESPDLLQYHINIDDHKNVLSKFEKIYQGKPIFFEDDEKSTVETIITLLDIDGCPYKLKNSLRNYNVDSYFGFYICSFKKYLLNEGLQTFTIITNKNEYKCNVFGICSSKILLDLVRNDPFINEYKYDFDDEFNEFQQISDLFNFKIIEITNSNMYALKEILNDLQIYVFIEQVDKFIEEAQKFSQTIDDQQTIVDSNEELFDWLYHIEDRNVVTVCNFIVHSDWIKTEEKVQEFVAFLLQVISTDSRIQTYIIDLIIELEKESKSFIYLRSFLISKLNSLLGINLNVCCFVYKLYHAKIITKEELINMIKNALKIHHKSKELDLDNFQKKIKNLVNWFYPEINENDEVKDQIGTDNIKAYGDSFVNKYYNNNIDGYLKMRDSGEPDDELTKALRMDDIDTFQKIIIEKGLFNSDNDKINISKAQIPYNLYDNYFLNGPTNYINYACAHGSVKCFKYLLLCHSFVNIYSLSAAVFGGNIEIIKTVDQILQQQISTTNINPYYYTLPIEEPIIPSIMKHKNDIFDWIFQEKCLNKNIDKSTMENIIICAAKNGNAHAFIEIIENGFDFISSASKIFTEISKNGYYLMTKLFFNIFQKSKVNEKDLLDFSWSAHFGNVSIFKESFENMYFEYQLIDALRTAIHFKYMNIIEYFINQLLNTKFKNSNEIVFECINASISKKSDELFNYFVMQFKKFIPTCFNELKKFDQLLTKACNKRNIKIIKKIIDMIVEYNHEKEDFTASIYYALMANDIEICKYFVENKLFINYEKLSLPIPKLSTVDKEIFSFIIENASDEEKYLFLNKNYLEHAITYKNISLIEYLLNSKIVSEKSLFLAVSTNDIYVVNIILKYNSNPSFINNVSEKGTALCTAVENKNLSIVKLLLSVPGIDPSLLNRDKKTPLLLAINNLEILNEILNFYDKESNIKNKWQFNKALKMVLKNFNKLFPLHSKHVPTAVEAKVVLYLISVLMRILVFKEIDPNCFVDDYTTLLYACTKNGIDIVKILLRNQKTDVNLCSPTNGNTPLMVSILNHNFEIAKMLIEDPRTNLNAKNFEDESALILAVNEQLKNVVDLLIHNERFDPEESNINKAFYLSFGSISNLLSSIESIDVNYQYNKTDQLLGKYINFEQLAMFLCTTTLMDSVEKNDIEKVDLIINHPCFDKAKSRLIKSIFIAVEKGHFEIFKKLIKINDDDVNIQDSNRNILLNFAVITKRTEIAEYILDCQSFDPKKCDILAAFTFYIKNVTDESINMMNKLYKYDKMKTINFNELLPTGESFFTLIASQKFIDSDYINVNSSQTAEIASFLIDHGVDPNIPDKRGFYPLEYAILLESPSFVRVLLDSNKINLNQIIKIKDTKNWIYENQFVGCLKDSKAVMKTYLHIAARSRVVEILKLLVETDAIDINSTDEFGETPLFEACRFNRDVNIEYLMTLEAIDFKCCNCDGDDALKMSMNLLNKNPDFKITNREDYAKALLFVFKGIQNNFNYDTVE